MKQIVNYTIYLVCILFQHGFGIITVMIEDKSATNESVFSQRMIVTEDLVLESNITQLETSIHWFYLSQDNGYSSTQAVSDIFYASSIEDIILAVGAACQNRLLIDMVATRTAQVYCYNPAKIDHGVLECITDTNTQLPPMVSPIDYSLISIGDRSELFVICTIITDLSWESAVIIYDKSTENLVVDISKKLQHDGFTFIGYIIDDVSDIMEVLSTSYEDVVHGFRNFIVLCSISRIHKVLYQADKFDELNEWRTAMRQMSKWLVLNPIDSMTSLNVDQLDLDNVAFIKLHQHVFDDISDISHLKQKLKEDISTSFNNVLVNNTMVANSERVSISLKDSFEQAIRTSEQCWKAVIYTLLWKPGGRSIVLEGHVTNNYSVKHSGNIFPNTKYGFNNRTFVITTHTWFPYITKTVESTGEAVYNGFCMDLLKELASSMNFSYKIVEPEDGEWGVINDNGSWTGMVKQLMNREADLIVAPLVISSERLEVMDFSFPFFHDYSSILFKLPDPNSSKWRKLVDPFKWEVFLCIFISFVLLTSLFCVLERSNPFYVKTLKKRHSFPDQIVYIYGAMLTQGSPNQPKSASGRFIIAFWWLFSIIVAATYSGNLIAFLTVTKDRPPFETLADLSNQNEYKWGTIGGTIWYTFLKSSNSSDIKALWRGVEEFSKTDPDVLDIHLDVHIKKVETEPYAFIADKGMFEMQMASRCDWVFLKEFFYPLQYAIGIPRKSPYYKLFYDEMLRIYETGLLQIWKKRWWPKQSTCKGSLVTESKRIELVDLQSAFYVIGIGLVVATISITIEYIYSRVNLYRLHHSLNKQEVCRQ